MASHSEATRHSIGANLAGTFLGIWGEVSSRLGRIIKVMQHARMMSVLSGFSDERLAALGITRDEIPAHAAMLVGIEDE